MSFRRQEVEVEKAYLTIPSSNDLEHDTLLFTSASTQPKSSFRLRRSKRFTFTHLLLAFLGGFLSCGLVQLLAPGSNFFYPQQPPQCQGTSDSSRHSVKIRAAPSAGSMEVQVFPPASPTNAYPSLFPQNVGYAGGTPTGAEPAVVATAPAYPFHTEITQLVAPKTLGGEGASKGFDLFKSWSNLSPWYSVGKATFGLDTSPEAPETCRVTGLHLLHRHGARYPTGSSAYAGPARFANRLHASPEKWNASGNLEFLNEWTYKLGEEVLTPFGRQQLYDLGISMRLKYGFLLKNFTDSNTIPVFRTESQDRMLKSALNFALGFFGYPLEGQYQQSITLETPGVNNTLAPYDTCPNSNDNKKGIRGIWYLQKWAAIYLAKALARLQAQIHGFTLTIEDVYAMQQTCAYETVALGYSKYCELFTKEEWEGFDYGTDLVFWYGSAFGSPVGRVQGIGYVQELVARLTHTPIATHNSSTNATLDDNPITFPLKQSLYVDATHEVVVLNILTALNLTNFAASGPLPYDRIIKNRSFKTSQLAPFATNVQFQLLECTSVPGQQIRIIINDGVTPLTGIKGCPKQKDGMCPVSTFVAAQKEIIAEVDWNYDCYGDWEVPEGTAWNTTIGSPPQRS